MKDQILIRKQKIRIKAPDETTAFAVRKQLDDRLLAEITAIYANSFTAIARSGTVYIDKLVLDLGTCKASSLQTRFGVLLKDTLVNKLAKHPVAQKQTTSDNNSDPVDSTEVVFYFLQKGIVPWWYQAPGNLPIAKLLSTLSNEVINHLFQKIQERGSVEVCIKRMFCYLDPSAYSSLIRLLPVSATVQQQEQVALLQQQEIIAWFIAAICKSEKEYWSKLVQVLLSKPSGSVIDAFVQAWDNETYKEIQVPKNIDPQITEALKRSFKEKSKTPAASQYNTEVSNNESSNDVIYISNAGLVILHPFLPALFKELDLLDESGTAFSSEETLHKAIVMLQYCCNGDMPYEETEMAFNKILCGAPVNHVLPPGLTLSGEEKNECDRLLESVIGHWQALKGSGVPALQETFLKRFGKMTYQPGQWKLQVERTTPDILIDRLPWGISIARLPWCDHLILVEW